MFNGETVADTKEGYRVLETRSELILKVDPFWYLTIITVIHPYITSLPVTLSKNIFSLPIAILSANGKEVARKFRV